MKDLIKNQVSNNYAQRVLPLQLSSVSAIVVTFRSGAVLKDCLEALLKQEELTEIIVVNNGNPSSIRDYLIKLSNSLPKVRIFEPGRNTGFAAGCNLGAAHATGDFLAFVNPDCLLPEGTIQGVLDVFDKHKNAWLCGGKLLNPDGTEQRGGRRDVLTPWIALVEMFKIYLLFPRHPSFRRFHLYEDDPISTIKEVPTVSGAFMVIPRRYYARVGGMDDNMFLHFDDSDLCIRIINQGGTVLYCGNIPIYHHQGSSDVSRLFIQWHKTRSTNYYFYKHFSQSYPSWFLLGGSILLWIRFIILAPFFLIGDITGILRRLFGG